MSCLPLLVADAVVSQINDADRNWTLPTATRAFVAFEDAKDLSSAKLTVTPGWDLDQPVRLKGRLAITLKETWIVLQQRVRPSDTATIDGLVEDVFNVAAYFAAGPALDDVEGFTVTEAKIALYSPLLLSEQGIFDSLVTLTVKGTLDRATAERLHLLDLLLIAELWS